MKHLTKAILADYDIALNAPSRTCAVQFGDDALLLGLVDRLLDDANAAGLNAGVALCGGTAEVMPEGSRNTVSLLAGENGEHSFALVHGKTSSYIACWLKHNIL